MVLLEVDQHSVLVLVTSIQSLISDYISTPPSTLHCMESNVVQQEREDDAESRVDGQLRCCPTSGRS